MRLNFAWQCEKPNKLLTDYYERKVLSASAALIYGFGGPESCRREAEKFGDEAVQCYEKAATFIWETIDRKAGKIKGRWLDGKALTLPELIDRERRDRKQLATLFAWSKRGTPGGGAIEGKGTGPGTLAPSQRSEPPKIGKKTVTLPYSLRFRSLHGFQLRRAGGDGDRQGMTDTDAFVNSSRMRWKCRP